ncbi:HAMP domain-containing sensor histidine kinase [Demequina sp.]|uniref:sensor histidine kinase n=1 Tax=Demequina sp. TaxID=2050685 RepID=UPI0025C485F0|nr:HAMP domain-containing sensor histidine kinase [Demequina sp.]
MSPRARMPRGWTIRAKVATSATAVLALALLVASAGLVLLVHRSLVANVDSSGRARVADVAAIIAADGLQPTISLSSGETSLIQVVSADGRVLSSSANVQGEAAVLPAVPASRVATTATIRNLPIGENGHGFRIYAEPIDLPTGLGWVYVAHSLSQVDAAVASVILVLSVGLPFLVFLVGSAVWVAIGRALAPIEAIRSRAVVIGKDLSQRVPVPVAHDEVHRLATTVNEMLAQLEASALRQERFMGDASHELRSPLTALRTQVDVALAHPERADFRETLEGVHAEAARLGALIDDVLLLARTSERLSDSTAQIVDLDELMLAEAKRLRLRGGIAVTLEHVDAVQVRGLERDIARMVRNLGDNAVRHARSTVGISVARVGQQALISIADDGPGVPVEDRTRVFERFTRLDDARSRDLGAGGAGLGLAIAKDIASVHSGAIHIESRADGHDGAVFVIALPAAHHLPG